MSVANFAYAATLLFRIRFKIPITYVYSSIGKIYSTIRLRRVKITISVMKLITSMTQTINLRRVKITASMKEIGKIYSTIYGRLRLTITSKAIQKVVSSIIIKKVVLIIDPTLAQFFTLGDYDPQTLGDLDALTLGEMDYTT